MDNVLLPTEIEFYVQTMMPSLIDDIGNENWLNWHKRIVKLNQQALIEAANLKEEKVKEALVLYDKVSVLVHEATLINIWKHKVLPKMLQLKPNPSNTFMTYTVLYHEAVCVVLLELVLFHESCCEALSEFASDLLDYATGLSRILLTAKYQETVTDESAYQEIQRHFANLNFEIGIRCLTIIRYITDNFDRLPLDACNRVYSNYDVPILFIEILRVKPWIKNGKQYFNGKWIDWDGESLPQADAQIWLALRQLLLHPACHNYYPLTNSRKASLAQLQYQLTPTILDQLAPLVDLKLFLARVTIVDETAPEKPLLFESVLEIKSNIINSTGEKWNEIANRQIDLIFCDDQKKIVENAKVLSEAYNPDLLEKMEADLNQKKICNQCGDTAIQCCSNCQNAWYCSRDCQVKHWPQHNCVF